ncbi:ubiquitin C-terminal hydrolase 15-like, partial [Musa acuminata AAA Group]|uniref:ubiquitin C-terminal hydrolase 15-like n=1 Tax=Musa acuminata AAA Group TaxID=214697 RepID=UPI0031DB6FDC
LECLICILHSNCCVICICLYSLFLGLVLKCEVFRCQFPRSNPFYSDEPPRHYGTDKPLSVGAALCSWCGTWKGEKVCSRCRRACYCSEKHQAMHWKSGHKNQCHQIITNLESSSASAGSSRARLPATDKEGESAFYMETSEDNSCATTLVPKYMKTDDTYQFLLDKFEADENKRYRRHHFKNECLNVPTKC